MILELTQYHIIPIFVEWINLVELAMMDTAICSHRQRVHFLRHISTEKVVFHGHGFENIDSFNCFGEFGYDVHSSSSISRSLVSWLNLRAVKVDHAHLSSDNLGFVLCTMNVGSLKSMCFMQARWGGIISDELVSKLCVRSKGLTTLSLMSNDGDQIISETSLLFALSYYPMQLKSLSIGISPDLVTPNVIMSIATNQCRLTHLNLSASNTIEDSDIEYLSLRCQELIYLNISRNVKLTARRSALAIVNHLIHLKNIHFDQDLSDVSIAMFKVLRRRFSKITRLDLTNHIAEGIPVCGELCLTQDEVIFEINHLSKTSFGLDVLNINDHVHFIPACNDIRSVCLPESVYGLVLDTFIWHCSAHIRVLDLKGYAFDDENPQEPENHMTDSSLFIIAAKCRLLEHINFSHREFITDDGMIALVNANRNLTAIYCVGCLNLGALTVNAIARCCHSLEILNISSCGELGDECLINLSAGCHLLAHIGLKNIDTSADAIVVASDFFVKRCTQLKNVQFSCPHQSYTIQKHFFTSPPNDTDHYIPELDDYF